jgi:hypothetical protein
MGTFYRLRNSGTDIPPVEPTAAIGDTSALAVRVRGGWGLS